MLRHGYDLYLLDWGAPGPEDAGITFDDYALEYLPRVVRKRTRRYLRCMAATSGSWPAAAPRSAHGRTSRPGWLRDRARATVRAPPGRGADSRIRCRRTAGQVARRFPACCGHGPCFYRPDPKLSEHLQPSGAKHLFGCLGAGGKDALDCAAIGREDGPVCEADVDFLTGKLAHEIALRPEICGRIAPVSSSVS